MRKFEGEIGLQTSKMSQPVTGCYLELLSAYLRSLYFCIVQVHASHKTKFSHVGPVEIKESSGNS